MRRRRWTGERVAWLCGAGMAVAVIMFALASGDRLGVAGGAIGVVAFAINAWTAR